MRVTSWPWPTRRWASISPSTPPPTTPPRAIVSPHLAQLMYERRDYSCLGASVRERRSSSELQDAVVGDAIAEPADAALDRARVAEPPVGGAEERLAASTHRRHRARRVPDHE